MTIDTTSLIVVFAVAAAGLPLIVAITEVATQAGGMTSQVAATLVGAGMLSVLVYPLLALAIERRGGSGAARHD